MSASLRERRGGFALGIELRGLTFATSVNRSISGRTFNALSGTPLSGTAAPQAVLTLGECRLGASLERRLETVEGLGMQLLKTRDRVSQRRSAGVTRFLAALADQPVRRCSRGSWKRLSIRTSWSEPEGCTAGMGRQQRTAAGRQGEEARSVSRELCLPVHHGGSTGARTTVSARCMRPGRCRRRSTAEPLVARLVTATGRPAGLRRWRELPLGLAPADARRGEPRSTQPHLHGGSGFGAMRSHVQAGEQPATQLGCKDFLRLPRTACIRSPAIWTTTCSWLPFLVGLAPGA